MDFKELRDEYEIDLRAMLITILQRWRIILLCTIAAGIMLSGYRYLKFVKETAAGENVKTFKTDDVISLDQNVFGLSAVDNTLPGRYRTAIANYEDIIQRAVYDEVYIPAALANKQAIQRMQNYIPQSRKYLSESLRDDAYGVESVYCNLLIRVEGANREAKKDIKKALILYRTYLTDADLYEELAERWGTQSKYINELVTVGFPEVETYTNSNYVASDDVFFVLQAEDGTDLNVGSMLMEVRFGCESREKTEELSEYILDHLNTFNSTNEALKDYSVELMETRCALGFNRGVLEDFDNNTLWYAQMETLTAQYKRFCNANAELISQIEAKAEGQGSEAEDANAAAPARRSVSKRALAKYGILGMLLGMVGSTGFLFLYYLLRGTIFSENEINGLYRLRPLATLRGEQGRRHRTILDRWLRSCKEDISYRSMDETARYGVLETKTRAYAGDGVKRFLVVGTSEKDPLQEIAHKLGTRMKDCTFDTTSLLNGTRESLDSLERCEGIIMILNLSQSRHCDVEKDIETALYYGKEIIGTVAII